MKPQWLIIAENELGIREIPGKDNTKRILEYHTVTTLRATNDETAWCSAFVNWCMKQAGQKYTNSAAARSWLDYGTVLDEPQPGCIVILKRGTNPQSGHVGFFVSELAGGFIKILGGNQGDQVKYSNYPKADVLGYRWPKEG